MKNTNSTTTVTLDNIISETYNDYSNNMNDDKLTLGLMRFKPADKGRPADQGNQQGCDCRPTCPEGNIAEQVKGLKMIR